MKAFVITLQHDKQSKALADNFISSSKKVKNDFSVEYFDAITPEQAYGLMHEDTIKWNYPWSGQTLDMASGLLKTAYSTVDPRKRIACFLSHYFLWKKCVETNENIFVFEHDALFTSRVELELLNKAKHSVISINSPIGATRKAALYNEKVITGAGRVVDVPKIDEDNVPQGLPGNSAYYIKPAGASKLMSLVQELGAWPNDAIMCRQLMPSMLGCLKPYCTVIQKSTSFTSL